jgi:hypothetical protein
MFVFLDSSKIKDQALAAQCRGAELSKYEVGQAKAKRGQRETWNGGREKRN